MNSYEGGFKGTAQFLKKDPVHRNAHMQRCCAPGFLNTPNESQKLSCKRSTLPQNRFLQVGWAKLSLQDPPLLHRQTRLTDCRMVGPGWGLLFC